MLLSFSRSAGAQSSDQSMAALRCCAPRCLGRLQTYDESERPARATAPPISNQVSVNDIMPSTPHVEQPSPTVAHHDYLAPLKGPIELDQLVVEDSDTDDNDSAFTRRETGTLDTVRSRLIRQFSHESNMRRRSHIAVGKSDEEIARRAELRRLRQKRIQDELKVEGTNDASSKKSNQSTPYLPRLAEHTQPGNGPRDNIEFAVLSCKMDLGNEPTSSSGTVLDGASPQHTDELQHRRRSSCPQSSMDDQRKTAVSIGQGDRISLPDMKQELDTAGQCLSSVKGSDCHKVTSPGTKTCRDERAGIESSSQQETTSWDDQSALGVWLVAQGLRSRDNSAMRLVDVETEIASIHEPQQEASPEKLDDAQSMVEASVPGDQHDLTVPLAAWKRWTSERTVESDLRDELSETPTAIYHMSIPQLMDSVTGPGVEWPLPFDGDKPPTALHSPVDNTSSNYPSVLPSLKPSPAQSQSNPHRLSVTDIDNLQLSPFKCEYVPWS